jgi:hypothetical protein
MTEDVSQSIKMGNFGESARGDEDHLPVHFISLRVSINLSHFDQMRIKKREKPFLKGLQKRGHIEIV